MQLMLALDSGSACGVFPGHGKLGHAVPCVSADNFTVCDDKARLHGDKQADVCVALMYVASSIIPPQMHCAAMSVSQVTYSSAVMNQSVNQYNYTATAPTEINSWPMSTETFTLLCELLTHSHTDHISGAVRGSGGRTANLLITGRPLDLLTCL